jgi:hypothetical protein
VRNCILTIVIQRLPTIEGRAVWITGEGTKPNARSNIAQYL